MPGIPELGVHILYAYHYVPEDLNGLEAAVQGADIFSPELFGWKKSTLARYRDVASGRKQATAVLLESGLEPWRNPQFYLLNRELQSIHASGVRVVCLDVPYDHALVRREGVKLDVFQEVHPSEVVLKTDFQGASASMRDVLREVAVQDTEREDYMVSQVEPTVTSLLERCPELRKQSRVRMLLLVGAVHIGLFRILKAKGYDVTKQFSEVPFVYDFGLEAIMKFRFGKEVSDELIARCLLQKLFDYRYGSQIQAVSGDTLTAVKHTRRLLSVFNLDEIENIFQNISQGANFSSLFELRLQEKGLVIPY